MHKTKTTIMLMTLLLAGLPGFAQSISGSISGRVVDAQGGVVPNAFVTITEPSKNLKVSTKTSTGGDFLIPGLLPGTYSVTVENAGFKRLSVPGIAVDANDKLALGDLVLEVGAVTETIDVSAQATLLQTESVERSATISGTQISNIEVNGRSPLDLAKLVPGVQFTTGSNYAVASSNGANDFTVNGARPSQNQLTINGIGNVDTGNNGGLNVAVSLDSIAEFKILTNSYQAEYGRSSGGQINVVTKSGTDHFHGSGYWQHRNDSLNANTFLNNARNLPRPLFRYNDVGYTIGGPVYIPHLERRTKDKLFFFYSQEFQRQLSPNAVHNVLVPTALERKGDFSQSLNNNAQKLTFINDPLNGAPFPGLMVPQNRLYAPGQALLNLFPLPNSSQVSNFNYTSQVPGEAPRQETLLRVDYNVSEKLRVFGHWIDNRQPTVAPYGSFVLGSNLPITPISNPVPGNSIAGGATWTISPTMTNELNLGFTHNSILITESGNALTTTATGINLPELYPNAVQDNYIPNVTFNGTRISASPSLGTGDAPFVNYNTTIDITDNLTRIWGKHTIKAGIYTQRSRKDQTSFGNFNGSYNFGDNPNNPFDSGFGFSNALLGVYNTYTQAANHINGLYRYWNIEQYVQDTWKVTSRLTLDYGLRAAWYQPQYDASREASTFIPSQFNAAQAPMLYLPAVTPGTASGRSAFNPLNGQYLPSFDVGLEIPGTGTPFQAICQAANCPNGKYLTKDRGLQWAPRFGFAWDVTGKQNLVVRAGGGIYYDRIQGNRTFDSVTNPPEAVSPTLNQNLVSSINPSNVLLGPPNLVAVDPTGKVPNNYNYQISVQYRLPQAMTLDVGYVGTLGRHLQDNKNLNFNNFGQCFQKQNQDPQLVAANPNALLGNNCLGANFLKPYQGYGNINLYQSEATSNYNALQLNLQRRATKGLFLGAAYTWSKALSTAQSGGTNDNAFVRPDGLNREANYGPSSFDRRQVLAINYVYELPKLPVGNALTRAITGGWQISGVTQAVTGSPFTPGFSIQGAGNQNITGSNTEPARIGVVPGCNPYTGSSDPFNRLNPACFFAPSPGSMGLESGINYLYGPSIVNFDMALQKQFVVKERLHFQFRVDAFNVFNHTDFSGYNGTLNFNSYPNANGLVTGSPTITPTALGRNANGAFNVTGFGTVTQTSPGALGYARILQTLIRVTF